jgi:uncharacterized membrane protein
VRANLKKSFLTGLFVIFPLVISIALLVWFFRAVDSLFSHPIDGILNLFAPGTGHIPGTGILAGLVIILVVGIFARNVVGERVLDALDRLIQRIPWYRTVYSTVKQLTDAFSPENTKSFKEVVLVEYPGPGSRAIGFHTGTVEVEGKSFALVYVPTNHLYLGEVILFPTDSVQVLQMRVEQAIRLLVSGGIATPDRIVSIRSLSSEKSS